MGGLTDERNRRAKAARGTTERRQAYARLLPEQARSPHTAPLQRVYHAISEVRRHRIFRLEVGVSGGYLEDLLEVHSRMLGNDLRRYIANAH